MATPFEYGRFHPTALRISRISDNTNHPKYSLSPVFSLAPVLCSVFLFSYRCASCPRALSLAFASCCRLPTLTPRVVLKLSRTRHPQASFIERPLVTGVKFGYSLECPASCASLSFLPGDACTYERKRKGWYIGA